jgi:two-component system sensor histidine kinase GlrK
MREGTELLADRVAGPLTPEQQEIVEILDNSSRNLQKLIEQLLDYNRKQADGPIARETGTWPIWWKTWFPPTACRQELK